ncbi:MAG TPA: glycogen debranching enzyme N-terminal domain-containing protein, partial [Steroidobacteraceae bacterium]|nr:glycogen debranching enzyme N-terminal domain-containing protein [Steroidobacteraceae bacterium]
MSDDELDGRSIVLRWHRDRDPLELRRREWLITNGLGGYSSGTISGIHTRKYHGLFVPNLAAPKGRHIMISRCDESLVTPDRQVHLGGAEFEHERFVGESHRYLQEFRLDHRIAVWTFELDDVVLEKSIVMPHNQNTVCVQYRLLRGSSLDLRVRPFVSFRRHDATPPATPDDAFVVEVRRGFHEIRHAHNPLVLRVALRPGPTRFMTDEVDDRQFVYRVERDRGDPAFDSAFSPGYFAANLTAGQPVVFVASMHAWDRMEFDGDAVFDAERRRMSSLLSLAPHLEGDAFAEQLAMAADQFVVLPGSRLDENVMAQAEGSELRSIYAGYHWFGDWGRDTMISLEGLTLATGRYREAGAILRTFSHYIRDGLLPNLFPEGERDEHQFVYRVERDRGDPAFDSAFSPGYFAAKLSVGEPMVFVASMHAWDRMEFDANAVFDAERRRMGSLLALAPHLEGDAFAEQLAMAADQFVVLPGSRLDENVMAQAEGSELRSIYAGYHWFGDWGR